MSNTQKISLVGIFLVAIFAFSLITPAEARERDELNRESHASSTKERDDRTSSSTKERGDKMSSSTPKVNAACMQTAVAARETSITSAWTTFTSAILSGLEARKNALYSAWGLSDAKARNQAIKTSTKAWESADKKAHEALKKSRNSAWETFKKTAKDTCKMSLPKEGELGKEAKGSIEI